MKKARTYGVVVTIVGLLLPITISTAKILNYRALQGAQTERNALNAKIDNHVKLGSEATSIFAFLDSERIRHTQYESANNDAAAIAIIGAAAIIEGRVPVRSISLTQYSIHLIFKFDTMGHLIGYSSKIEGTFY